MTNRICVIATAIAVALALCVVTPRAQTSGTLPLEGTDWKAVEVGGKPIGLPAGHLPFLLFQPGKRVSGSDGCNRLTGSYVLKGDAVMFGPLASTRRACLDIGDVDRAFSVALNDARRLRVVGDRLELSDADGKRVVIFRGTAQPAAPARGR